MSILVTHTLHPDVLELLKQFAPKQQVIETPNLSAAKLKPATEKKKIEPPADKIETPAEQTEPGDKVPTIVELRAAIADKRDAKPGNREAMKGWLAEYGVDKVTDLDKKHYGEFLTKVKAL